MESAEGEDEETSIRRQETILPVQMAVIHFLIPEPLRVWPWLPIERSSLGEVLYAACMSKKEEDPLSMNNCVVTSVRFVAPAASLIDVSRYLFLANSFLGTMDTIAPRPNKESRNDISI